MAVCETSISNLNNFPGDSGLDDMTGKDRSNGESADDSTLIQSPKSQSRKRGRRSSLICEQRRHSPRLLNVRTKTRTSSGHMECDDTSEDSDPNIHFNGIADLDDQESDLALLEEEEKQQVIKRENDVLNEQISEKEMVEIAIYKSLEKKAGAVDTAVNHDVNSVVISSHVKNKNGISATRNSNGGVTTRLRKRQRNTKEDKISKESSRLTHTKKLQTNANPSPLSSSRPVPNPILMPPQSQSSLIGLDKTSKVETEPKIKIESDSIGNETRDGITETQGDSLSIQTKCIDGDAKSVTISNSLDANKNGTNNKISVSFKVEDDCTSAAPISSAPQRKRIFSIDFDPEGFDFDSTMDETGVDYTLTDVSDLPPITPSATSQNPKSNTNLSEMQASNVFSRDRGMSFELFSFDHNANSSTDPLVGKSTDAFIGGRPRGDSIIFDPISFKEGGIHEVDALRKFRCNSLSLEGPEELSLLNSSELITTQSTGLHSQSRHQDPIKSGNTSVPNPVSVQPKLPTSRAKTTNARSTKSISKVLQRQNKRPHVSKQHLTVVSGTTLPSCTEDTIHMPQGSAAARAAAASLPSQILPSSLNGTISHTACPMELLNRGGRIGIYLPEARRERIAKFHSKRKMRIWRKRIKYDCRKKLADSRPRIKGRFVKSLDEE